MTPERLIRMVANRFLKRLLRKGMSAGTTRISPAEDTLTQAEKQQARQARRMARRARQAQKLGRRLK